MVNIITTETQSTQRELPGVDFWRAQNSEAKSTCVQSRRQLLSSVLILIRLTEHIVAIFRNWHQRSSSNS